jgi:DNA-binding transcriptional ArsR family regulator
MDVRALQNTDLFAAAVAVASTLVLAVQLITPSPVIVSTGESGTKVTELSGYFTYWDVGVIVVAACLLGVSATYLLVGGRASDDAQLAGSPAQAGAPVARDGGGVDRSDELLEARREEWAETAERLSDKERAVYEAVLDADGVLPQSDVVEQTDLSKASVSRTLDALETRNLVERKRRGMGNVVLLQ